MKCACFLIVLSVLIFSSTLAQRPGEGDVTRLLQNRAYVDKQINCVLDKGGCDSIGQQLKTVIPEVLGKGCRNCTPRQLDNSRKVINFIRSNYPGAWAQIEGRYGRARI